MKTHEKLAVRWNDLIRSLEEAKAAWLDCKKLIWDVRELPVDLDRVFARVNKRADFSKMLVWLVGYWKGYGGLEALFVKEPEPKAKEKRKEKKNG